MGAIRTWAWILLLAAWTSTAAAQPSTLSRSVDRILDDAADGGAWWGIHMVRLDRDTTLYARNADRLFVPASNVKLFTTAAALDELGPSYRYATTLFIDGSVVDGTLRGNVIIRGAGDPTLGSPHLDEDALAPLRAWTDSLKAMGIRHVEGAIIGDDDVFDETPYGDDWAWGDLQYYWAAEISGLSFRDNVVDVEMRGQHPGAPARLSWEPMTTDYVSFLNATRTSPPGSSLDEGHFRYPGTNRFRLFSRVPPNGVDRETLSVTNPTLYLGHVFREVLLEEGISIDGVAVDVDDLPIPPTYTAGNVQAVATTSSPPLSEIAEIVNTESMNLYAEHVLRTLGVERPLPDAPDDVEPGSAEMGWLAAREMLAEAGVDTSRIAFVDGSGLSRLNLTTPAATTSLLRAMWRHPDPAVHEAYLASLARGGDTGTLSYRLQHLPAGTTVRAKTGSLTQASALSGYVTTARGATYAFSIYCNHYTVPSRTIRQAQDRLVGLIARYAPSVEVND